MNETCRPGTAYLFQLNGAWQTRVDSALVQTTYHTEQEGMSGIPLPYQLRSDGMITAILFLFFILGSYIVAHNKKYLLQRVKDFTLPKERTGLFDETLASEARYTAVFLIQTFVLAGFCVYDYFLDHEAYLFRALPHGLLLSTYVSGILLTFGTKWVLYRFINWVFFDKTKNTVWMRAFFTVYAGTGFLLFPVVLLIVYFDLSPQITLYFVGFVILFVKALLLYTCFNNFFNNIHGTFHLILYFCGVEIIPVFLLWKGIVIANDMLVLNF